MSLKLINSETIKEVAATAQNSSRRRSIYTYHNDNADKLHRMINVIEPDSYIQPHKHEDPDKTEVFIILQGKLLLAILADDGRVMESVVLEAGKSPWGVEIPPSTWHITVALEPDTAVYEVLEGPWDPATHKKLAPFAPAETEIEAGQKYIASLRQELMLY